jgi:hypothetical protein
MGKKLLGTLALVGAAAFLFKTKKGAEIRKNVADYADKTMKGLREKYGHASGAVNDRIDAQMA